MTDRVRVGLLAPQYGAGAEEALAAARAAEDAGLDVWVAGQLLPMDGSNARTALEPLALMGAIAAVTSTARLGFMVLAAPYLPPLYLAKALLTLDELSAGRLEIGLGAGWREQEFAALGRELPPLADRLATLELTLDALEELAGEPTASGRWPASARAGSGRPRPPVWIAGGGPKVLRLAARRAQWTNFARGISVDDFRAKGLAVAAAAREEGCPAPGLSLTATFMIGEPDDLAARLAERARARGVDAVEYERRLRAANVFVGGPEEIAEQLREYVGAGCSAFVLWPLDGNHARVAAPLGAAARALDASSIARAVEPQAR
jgi:alkanesulfonate monooxygenase SsuD/methylene tetrahydromethanopterin reductase-like flavin-dependent oxidoreductase (luciferase family)